MAKKSTQKGEEIQLTDELAQELDETLAKVATPAAEYRARELKPCGRAEIATFGKRIDPREGVRLASEASALQADESAEPCEPTEPEVA